jgi:hypothetical protein
MRKLAVALFALSACGSDAAKPDAAIVKLIDASIDAHPDSPPPPPPIDAQVYDYSCATTPLPTTAADPITISGTSQEISTSGLAGLAGVTVASFKTGTATALNTVTSGAGGTFTSGNLVTGGTPLDGYVEATVPGAGSAPSAYRGTFIYPADPLVANLAGAPVIVIKQQTFTLLASTAAGFTQDDTTNGALLVLVTDCAGTPVNGATVTAKQGTTDVSGMSLDLGAFSAQAAGTFFVFNVPAGATDVGATYDGHTFRTHSVMSYKADATTLPNGALTLTIVKPGP